MGLKVRDLLGVQLLIVLVFLILLKEEYIINSTERRILNHFFPKKKCIFIKEQFRAMSILAYNNKEIEYKVSNVNLAIVDSYKIKNKANMKNILYKIMDQESEHKFDVFKRSVKGMVQEWRAHNIIYNLGLFRTHTCTVDLEANQKWIFKIIWKIIGTF